MLSIALTIRSNDLKLRNKCADNYFPLSVDNYKLNKAERDP